MNTKRFYVGVLGAAVMLLPSMLVAQLDPSAAANPYPQSPQGINQPSSNQPGSTPPTGAQTTPSTSMRDSLGAPGQTGQQMLDKKFMRSAAQAGMADVKLGTLAVQKGGPEVKELAQKLVDDHSAMNKDMEAVADALGVMLPKKIEKDAQAEYDKLSSLSGKDFDTEFIVFMTNAHYQELHNFHQEASVAADPDLQSEVIKAMHTMHQHVGMIVNVAKADGITLPPRPPRPDSNSAPKP
ncbi:MAG TPA: DUF4142 domain-containing protein [Acidobacteriaceae bacterium]